MIQFILDTITPMGSAHMLENGDTIQPCNVTVKINGITAQDKTLTDYVEFTVPNSVMTGSDMPTVAGWTHIKEVLAPEWVAVQYSEIS